eukprot:309342-Pyramimonas_sp.AAC.1
MSSEPISLATKASISLCDSFNACPAYDLFLSGQTFLLAVPGPRQAGPEHCRLSSKQGIRCRHFMIEDGCIGGKHAGLRAAVA